MTEKETNQLFDQKNQLANRSGALKIAVVMGSRTDWDVMRAAIEILQEFSVAFEVKLLSAHRTPDQMFAYAQSAYQRGVAAIIAGAGGAAHLPGMLAAKSIVPVLGVPVPGQYLQGQDALYSIVQMPKGIPVATFAIGVAGAANAALYAIALLAVYDQGLAQKLIDFRQKQTVETQNISLSESF